MNDGSFALIGDWSDAGPMQGAVVLLLDLSGRVVLQFRDHGAPRHPGKWGFFGGGVEPGETLAEAAARELVEEADLHLPETALTPYVRLVSPESHTRLYIFRHRMDLDPADIRIGEGGGFGFFTTEDWRKLDLIPFARTVLERHVETAGG